jgi:hypothetical protein
MGTLPRGSDKPGLAAPDDTALNVITLLEVEVSDPGPPWDLVPGALAGEH